MARSPGHVPSVAALVLSVCGGLVHKCQLGDVITLVCEETFSC